MSRITEIGKIVGAVGLLLTQFCITAEGKQAEPVAPYGENAWTHHAAFDNYPRRVIDTPDAVYVLAYQHIYSKNNSLNSYYSQPVSNIWRIEKNVEGTPVTDYIKNFPLKSSLIETVEVEPESGMVVAAYTDGTIDIISKSGEVRRVSVIAKRTKPGANKINSISIDRKSGDIWIGASSGFVHISGTDLEIMETPMWNARSVQAVAAVGGRIILSVGNQLYEASKTSDLRQFGSYQNMASVSSGLVGNVTGILPLDASNFVILTDKATIYTVTLSGEAWTRKTVATDTAIPIGNQNIYNSDAYHNRTEHTATPTADGWCITSAAKSYLINRPASEGGAVTTRTVPLRTGSTRYTSTWDGVRFWTFRSRMGFCSADYTNSSWGDFSEPIMPDAPVPSPDVQFAYSPEQGFVCANREPHIVRNVFVWTDGFQLPLISQYRGGHWTNKSPYSVKPEIIEEGSDLYTKWLSYRATHYPIQDPAGFALDPIFPDYASFGTLWHGMASVNLTDPAKTPIISTRPDAAILTKLPGFPVDKSIAKERTSVGTNLFLSGYDADGNLWMDRLHTWATNSDIEQTISLMYMTPEARREALTNSDPTALGEWKILDFKGAGYPEVWQTAIMLRHERNRGKFLLFTQGGNIYLLDHKNTLEDTSDDTLQRIGLFVTKEGARMSIPVVSMFVENPVTGEVYVLGTWGSFVIDPTSEIVDNCIPARHLELNDGTMLSGMNDVKVACYDEYNRLWLGYANDGGVIGISSDGSNVVARYTSDNSPLMSGTIDGLGWNPETKSLFISTRFGMSEVRPDAPSVSGASAVAPYLLPEAVTADYGGTVALFNIPSSLMLSVRDSEGHVIARLPQSVNGVTHWNLLDTEGNMVRSGRYEIFDPTPFAKFESLSIPVIR